jgi:signal transduction histidine kinase
VTIRTRLTFWYATIMFVSLLVMGLLLHEEFAPQRSEGPTKYHRDMEDLEEAIGILLWCGVPAAVLALGGGWWLMRKSLAPVTALTRAAEKINERNLTEPLPRSRNGDELDRLAEVLNAMNARLNDSFTRIREFTLHASHELKTPLTILRGEAETALRDESFTPAQRERCASQLDELQRLTRIVDGLTLLAKADAGQVALASAPVQLDELVREVFADAQVLAQPNQVRVELTACEEVMVNGDAHRLRQLLLNLTDNAVKYNEAGGSISISLSRKDGAAEFTIANSGPGIAPEKLPRVFDRFFRGDPAHGNGVDGCGLGLSIAQWIVSAHRGTINITSELGKLTSVNVRLPLAD